MNMTSARPGIKRMLAKTCMPVKKSGAEIFMTVRKRKSGEERN